MPLRRLLRSVARGAIILFCLWHMAAVGLYAIPDPAVDGVTQWIKQTLQPWVRPYIYATSQWQQWNLFSPDPIRRYGEYAIRAEYRGLRATRLELTNESLGWWRATDEFTMIGKIEDLTGNTPILNRYISSFCEPLQIDTPGLLLRMRARYMVLPKVTPEEPQNWWTAFQPQWAEYESAPVSCAAGTASPILLP